MSTGYIRRALQCGALFVCLPGIPQAASLPCADWQPVRWENSLRALDGDTLESASGERIRLIGINSPELRGKRNQAEPLAGAATRHLQQYVRAGVRFALRPGSEERDRYGRTLAHVRRKGGWDLSALQLHHGYAMQIVVGGNRFQASCYQRQEKKARAAGKGVWSHPAYQPRSANLLNAADTGFIRLSGQVLAVDATRGAFWMELDGPVVIRLSRSGLRQNIDPRQWVSRRLETRGWLIDRRKSRAVREQGRRPFLLRVDDPMLLEWRP